MATSNYEETVRRAVANMTGDVSYSDKPKRPAPTWGLGIYFGFLGFGIGVLVGILTGWPTFFTGFGGVILAVGAVFFVCARRRLNVSDDAIALNAHAHDLEVQANQLEADVARKSGAFDNWEKK